jgi:hypothetical protein
MPDADWVTLSPEQETKSNNQIKNKKPQKQPYKARQENSEFFLNIETANIMTFRLVFRRT